MARTNKDIVANLLREESEDTFADSAGRLYNATG